MMSLSALLFIVLGSVLIESVEYYNKLNFIYSNCRSLCIIFTSFCFDVLTLTLLLEKQFY